MTLFLSLVPLLLLVEALYSVPSHIILIGYYIKIHQDWLVKLMTKLNVTTPSPPPLTSARTEERKLQKRISKLRTRVHCFMAIHTNYNIHINGLIHEMLSYVEPLSYYAGVVICFYCTLITFLIYILFLNTPNDIYYYLFSLVLWAHLTFLIAMLYFASHLTHCHRTLVGQYGLFACTLFTGRGHLDSLLKLKVGDHDGLEQE